MTEPTPADSPSRLDDGGPDRIWVLRGVRAAWSMPGIILIAAFVGFAGLARESGLTMAQTVFMVGIVWALPAKVVLTGSILSGTSLAGAALAVTLSSVRLMPMVVALTPELRAPKTRSWVLYVLSHIIAVTAWVIAMERFPRVPRERRTAFFAGMGAMLIVTNMTVTAIVFATAGAFPPLLSAVLFFITPLYFTTSLWGSARERAGHYAMILGLALGPVCRAFFPGIDLLVAGIVGGVSAYLLHRLLSRRNAAS